MAETLSTQANFSSLAQGDKRGFSCPPWYWDEALVENPAPYILLLGNMPLVYLRDVLGMKPVIRFLMLPIIHDHSTSAQRAPLLQSIFDCC